MDTNCTKYLVEYVSEHYDSAEHIFDPLFKFALDHQDFFSKDPIFTEDSLITLTKLHSLTPSDDIANCPISQKGILTWRADLALDYIAKEFEKYQYPASTFEQYLNEPQHTEAILKAGVSDSTNGVCLAALLFKSPLPEHVALKSRLGSELFKSLSKAAESKNIKDIVDILASAAPQKLEGSETEFVKALNNISQISNTWSHMKIADLSPKYKLKENYRSYNLSDEQFFEIYGGNYSLIPKCDVDPNFKNLTIQEQNAICVDPKEADYVKSFLIANFPKFHSLLNQNARTVYNQLKSANIRNFMNETKKYSSKLSYYSSDAKTLESLFNAVQHVNESHNVVFLSDMVNAIVDGYLPSLKRFKNSRVFNSSLASDMVSAGSNSLLLGASVYLKEPILKSSYSSLQSHSDSQIQQSLPKYINSLYCGSLSGGDSSDFLHPTERTTDTLTVKHFNTLIKIQKEFNSKFITEYRKMLDALVSIPDTDFKLYELPIMQQMIGQFNKVLIKDGHTIVKLTGVKEKNLNKEYTDTCEGLITVLTRKNIPSFAPLIPILQNIVKECKNVIELTTKERDEYFLAKKTPIDFDTYDVLVSKLDNEYIHFSKNDSVKIRDIVSRFRDFISSKIVPKGDESTYSRLKDYVSKLNDRNEAINRYFDEKIDAIKYNQSQQYSSSSHKILNPIVSMATTLINEHRKAYIWLNEKIDAFEVNDRIKQLKNRTFTEAELEKVANAYVEFNKYVKLNANKLGNKYKYFLNYESKNVCNFFKCYQLARETVEEIGSVNYLEKLYKILGIIDTNSDEWAQFKIGLTNYLALSTIWFDVYKIIGVKADTTDPKDPKINDVPINNDDDLNKSEIEYKEWRFLDGEDIDLNDIDTAKASAVANNFSELNNIYKFNELKKGRTYKLFGILDDIITGAGEHNFGKIYAYGTRKYTEENIKNAAKSGKFNGITYESFTKYGTALLQIIENKTVYNPYYVVGFSMRQMKDFNPIGANEKHEFYHMVLKSLYVPVLQQLDKYIRVRYTGTLDLNTNISKLMMGGNSEGEIVAANEGKQKAGSLYDYTEQHFEEIPKVIPEAFKFYICAYSVIKFYFEQLETIRIDKDKTTLTVEFNKHSNFADLNENIDKVGDPIKLINISANEYNLRKFLKIMNKYWNSITAESIDDKTTKGIEMISTEFNNLIIFGDINELKRIRDGTDHEIDLDKQNANYTRLNEDIQKYIDGVTKFIINAGINYDILLKKKLDGAMNEINNSHDEYGTLRKWIENVDSPKMMENDDRKLFIDVFLSPLFIINKYWSDYINMIDILPNYVPSRTTEFDKKRIIEYFSRQEVRPFVSSLIKYGKHSAKTVRDIIELSLQEYYEDMDNVIHHILGYKNYNDSKIKALVNHIHNEYKKLYDTIKEKFNKDEFKNVGAVDILPFITLRVPQFSQSYIEQNVFKKGMVYNDSFIKFAIAGYDKVKTFTQFITIALSKLSPHKYLPQYYVDALKSSELLNNTFSEIRSMGTYTIELFGRKNSISPDNAKAMPYNEEIIDVITSSLIYWSSSQLAIETDSKVANQIYKNKVVSLVPVLLHILNILYNRIDEHKEDYLITTGTSEYALKTAHDDGNDTINRTMTKNLQNCRTIRINAKSEISILKNILKGLYADFLPTATKMSFMNSGVVQSDHYLCEVRKLMEDGKVKFVDILENPEKFEWVLPVAKIDTEVEYMESKRFERYEKLINSIRTDADFIKSFTTVIKIIAKVIIYNILDSLEYSLDSKIESNALSGGDYGDYDEDELKTEMSVKQALSTKYEDSNKVIHTVIPDLLKLHTRISNYNGNLISSAINRSLSRFNSAALNYSRDHPDEFGQILTTNQLAAKIVYKCFKDIPVIDWKNLNIEMLMSSKILDNFETIYDDKDCGEDHKYDDFNIAVGTSKKKLLEDDASNDYQLIINKDNIELKYKIGDDDNITTKFSGGINFTDKHREIIALMINKIKTILNDKEHIKQLIYISELMKILKITKCDYVDGTTKPTVDYDNTKFEFTVGSTKGDNNVINIRCLKEIVDLAKNKLNTDITTLNSTPGNTTINVEFKNKLFTGIANTYDAYTDLKAATAATIANTELVKLLGQYMALIDNINTKINVELGEITSDELIIMPSLIDLNKDVDIDAYIETLFKNVKDGINAFTDGFDKIDMTKDVTTIRTGTTDDLFKTLDTAMVNLRKISIALYDKLFNVGMALKYLIGSKTHMAATGPNYYQIWNLYANIDMLPKTENAIKKLRNYLAYVGQDTLKNSDAPPASLKKSYIAKSKFKVQNNIQTLPLNDNLDIVSDMERIIGDDEKLVSIINNDYMWCVILAAVILKSNYGIFNQILHVQLRNLSEAIYNTYVVDKIKDHCSQSRIFYDCLKSIKTDKFVVVTESNKNIYYNTDIDITEADIIRATDGTDETDNVNRTLDTCNLFKDTYIQMSDTERMIVSLTSSVKQNMVQDPQAMVSNALFTGGSLESTLAMIRRIYSNTQWEKYNTKFNNINILFPWIYEIIGEKSTAVTNKIKTRLENIKIDTTCTGDAKTVIEKLNDACANAFNRGGGAPTVNNNSERILMAIVDILKFLNTDDYDKDHAYMKNASRIHPICTDLGINEKSIIINTNEAFVTSILSATKIPHLIKLILLTARINDNSLNTTKNCNDLIINDNKNSDNINDIKLTRQYIIENIKENTMIGYCVYPPINIFLQNAFVYDPVKYSRHISTCYDEPIDYLLLDSNVKDPNIEKYTQLYSRGDKLLNTDDVTRLSDITIDGKTLKDSFNEFNNCLIAPKPFTYETIKTMERDGYTDSFLGGDLYTIDSKELLKEYSRTQTIYDSIIETTKSPLYQLILAYYSNIILSFHIYFNKLTFIEILYNSRMFDTFFNKFSAAIDEMTKSDKPITDTVKVLIALILQSENKNLITYGESENKLLTKAKVSENYNKTMFKITDDKGYYEPSVIRRFLEMTYDPISESNISPIGRNQKLINYIATRQGDKLIDIIMNFERLNLRIGALFQFIKEFQYVPIGEDYESLKYTKEYKDNEIFDGQIASKYDNEIFNNSLPGTHE